MKLRYTPQAIQDLDDIQTYISEKLLNPEAAYGIVTSIAESAKRLKDEPYLGFEMSKKTGLDIPGRGLVSGQYLLIYEVTDCISILRVIDTRVDFMRVIGTW